MATKTNTTINGHDYYRITRTIGHEYKDGKKVPIKKQFLGRSKTEAERKYLEWRDEQAKQSEHVVDSFRPFGELAVFFRDNVFDVDSKYATGTKDRYKRAYRQFADSDTTGLIDKPINKVTPSDIQIAYNKFDVALSTVRTLNKFFRLFINWCALNNYCTDILKPVTIPVKPYTKISDKIVVWEDSELSQVLDAMEGHRLRLMPILAAYCGLRMGEVLGLKYSDIYDDTVHIKRQYTRDGEYKAPKYNSERDIPMHPIVMNELEQHKKWHLKEREDYITDNDLVFTTVVGTPYDHANIRHRFTDLYRKNSIPERKFHAYRATFCTNLCKKGVSIQTAASLMGHKNVDVTAKFYTLVSKDEKTSAIMKL